VSLEDRRTDDIVGRLLSLTREVDDLKALVIARLSGATQGGAFRIADSAGHLRVLLGNLDGNPTTGHYGVSAYDAAGNQRLYLDETGFGLPRYSFAVRDPAAVKVVTAGAFTQTWQVVMPQVLGPGLETWIGWSTDAGTTGEIRVNSFASTTTALALPAASAGNAYSRWLHGIPLGTGPIAPVVEARRTGGVGNVNIYQVMGWLREPADCTSAGVWL
jgi:hypothetical protein